MLAIVFDSGQRIIQDGQLLEREQNLSDDCYVGFRSLKVNYLNSFLRNHLTHLEKVRAHEFRVLGRCKFLKHLNSNMIPGTIGSVVFTAIPFSFSTLSTITQVVYSKPLAEVPDFLCALIVLFSVAFPESMSVNMDRKTIIRSNSFLARCHPRILEYDALFQTLWYHCRRTTRTRLVYR